MHNNQFFTTTIFATILCAQSGFAAELNPVKEDEQECWTLVDGKEECAEQMPQPEEVPASCCFFYTEADFEGDLFQVCASDYYQQGFIDVPQKFFDAGIESWVCGENTHLLIEEVAERKNLICPYGNTDECDYDRTQNSFTSQAWSSGDYSII